VSANTVHLVVYTFGFARDSAFHTQNGKFVRYDAQRPAGFVGTAASAIGKNFGRGS